MKIALHAIAFAVAAALLYWITSELGISLYKRSSAVDSEPGSFEISQMFIWSGVGAVVGAVSGFRKERQSGRNKEMD